MNENGYEFASTDLATLLLRRSFPEATDKQSIALRAFLTAHGTELDRFQFSVRVGTPIATNPDPPPAVQANAARFTRKRIDLLAWRGLNPVIVEAKDRIDPSTLGQILAYRQLWLEDNPNAPEPELIVVGSSSDGDSVRVLQAHGVTVYLYEAADAR